MSLPLVIGIDVGGTKMAAGVVDGVGRIVTRRDQLTPVSSSDDLIESIVDTVRELADEHPVQRVGLGVAGLVDADGRIVRTASHLPLRDDPVGERVAAATGLSVVIDNDVNVSALAELRLGAAWDMPNALMVAVGTGIGGAVIVDGRVHRGWTGAAGEIGHVIVERDGRPCPCGNRGCWEQYASGRALLRAAEAAGLQADHGRAITSAAQAGDERALGALTEIGGWLGVGIAGLVAVLDPEVVLIGGGVSGAGELLLEPTMASFRSNLTAEGTRPEPEITLAALGPDAGLIGAAQLALEGRE